MKYPGPAMANASKEIQLNRLDRLRVGHLRLLELVGSSGSLTAAASSLRISQPTATKMLQDLESAFAHSLVDRSTRGGKLTAVGQRVLERLRVATGSLTAIGEALDAEAQTPLVRIGILPLAGVFLIPRLIATLSASGELPRIRLVEGTVQSVLAMLREGHVDCVIGRATANSGHMDEARFDAMPLVDERLEIACGSSNALARKRQVALPDLKQGPWIIPGPGTYTRQLFDAAFAGMGMTPPQAQVESASFYVNLATVAQSDFLTVAPSSSVDYYASLGKVKKIRLAQPFQSDFSVFITLRHAPPLSHVEAIRGTLKTLCA